MDPVIKRQTQTDYTQSTAGATKRVGVNDSPPAGLERGDNVKEGSLSSPTAAGEMAYAAPTIGGTNWGALTDSVQAANLSVTITAIMVLMIEIMSQSRQDSREDALKTAIAALDQGIAAAANMEEAAKFALIAACISNGVGILTSVASTVTAGAQLKQIGQYKTKFENDAKAKFEYPDDAKDIAGYKKTDMQRSEYVTQQMTPVIQELAIKKAYVDGITGGVNAAAKMIEAGMTYISGMAQAEAQRNKATGEYLQSISQSELDFFRQLGDAIKSFLSGMESVEQAQHKATGAIYNC